MMELVGGRLDTFQRVLGMAIGSLPITILLGIYGFSTTGIPTSNQMLQGFLLALCSGVIATMTFFFATDLAKDNLSLLGAVEATQAGTMVFTVLGEIIFLNGSLPGGLSLIGMIIIMLGMVANSILNRSVPVVKQKNQHKKGYGSIEMNHTLFYCPPISPYQNSISLALYTKTYVIIRFMRINRR